MRERPIVFSSEMVRAILDGRKTMTRRPIKDPRKHFTQYNKGMSIGDIQKETELNLKPNFPCPYGQPGDRLWLWVRETWNAGMIMGYSNDEPEIIPWSHCTKEERKTFPVHQIFYKANEDLTKSGPWVSPIFMPRWASRITLEIVNVRVERLQEITEEDVIAEGIPNHPGQFRNGNMEAVVRFAYFWDSLYTKKPELQWEANCWVWVVEFGKPLEKPSET